MTTNYREILKLKSLGLNKTDIARSVQCARNIVHDSYTIIIGGQESMRKRKGLKDI